MDDDPSGGYFAPARAQAPVSPAAYPTPPGGGPWQPQASGPARPRERPGAVTAAAVVAFVQAGFVLLGAAALAVLAFGTRSALTDLDSNLSGLPVALAVVALVVAAVAALVILAGVNLLRGRTWAAVVLGVIEALASLSAFGGLSQGGAGSVLWLACSVTVLVLLVLPRSREFVGIS